MTEQKPQTIAIGIGCQRGVALATLEAALGEVLPGLGPVRVLCLASHAGKADEPGLLALARLHGWTLRLYPAADLAAVAVPQPSARVAAAVGTPSVAEAAALLAAGARDLLLPKHCYVGADGKAVTLAVAARPEPRPHGH